MRAALLLLVVGCGGASAPARQPAEPDLDLADAPAQASGLRPQTSAEPEPTARGPRSEAGGLSQLPRRRGRAIDLDFKDVDLADVFRLLADVGDVNIVVADDVKGKVTLRLRRVPWDQALAAVVKVKGLALERDGRIYLVTKP
jgi:type II secretory pathway component HofQ